MSCDTAKENASVVDSSVTEWTHEKGNLDDPENSSYEAKEDGPDERVYSRNQEKFYKTTYFIIKSLNHQNIQLSVEKGIWATQVMNEPILEEAFHNSGKVILIFSVNMSGFFQGYAQMMSSVGWRRDNIWSQESAGNNPWGRSFRVKWLRLCDLPFQKTLHLKNPLNDFKPVKISRDCQELPQDIGEALCELLDGQSDVNCDLRRDFFPSKRPCMEPLRSLRGDGYDVPPVHLPWTRTSTLYPSIFHPCQTEASQLHLTRQRSSGALTDNFSFHSLATKVTQLKDSRISRNFTKAQGEHDGSSQFALWSLSAERSPLSSSLTEDDFLDMSYEEYLEAHSGSRKQLNHIAALPTGSPHEFSADNECDAVSYSAMTKWGLRNASSY